MNQPTPHHFQDRIAGIVNPIVAGRSRKRRMREELLAHLLEIYEEELGDGKDESQARNLALRRFGDAPQLQQQLQESVPWMESIFIAFFCRKENQMSRFWVMWIGLVLVAFGLVFPQFIGGVLAGLAGVGLMRYCKIGGAGARLMVPLLGVFGVLFGMAIILPGLAKYKHEGYFSTESGLCLTAGILIVVAGLMLLVRSIAGPRVRMA